MLLNIKMLSNINVETLIGVLLWVAQTTIMFLQCKNKAN